MAQARTRSPPRLQRRRSSKLWTRSRPLQRCLTIVVKFPFSERSCFLREIGTQAIHRGRQREDDFVVNPVNKNARSETSRMHHTPLFTGVGVPATTQLGKGATHHIHPNSIFCQSTAFSFEKAVDKKCC